MKARVLVRTSPEEEAKFKRKSERNNDRFLNYAHRSIVLSIRDNAGFGDVRMARLIDGSYYIGRNYIDRYRPHEKTDEDYAVDSYYAMRRELLYIGWDPSVELWRDNPFSLADMELVGHQSAMRRAENDGYVQFANTMSFYVREMATMAAIQLHDADGFGAVRLSRVFDPFVADWMGLMRIYLRRDRAGLQAEMRRLLERFNRCAVFQAEYTL